MSQAKPQKTLTILNTRPSPMGEELQRLLTPQFISHHFPTVTNKAIELPNKAPLKQWLQDSSFAWIFVSRPTAMYFRQLLQQYGLDNFSPAGGVFAIGESTKSELKQFIRTPNVPTQSNQENHSTLQIMTPELSNSESFLTIKQLDDYQSFVQVKGKGGRELIGQSLTQRGKQYFPLELYQREMLQYSSSQVDSWLECDCILATSIDIAKGIFTNLSQQSSRKNIQLLLHKIKWVVLSERIKQFLIDNKIKEEHIFICEESDNSSIINTINLISK
ncbi:uroporphyrinogen-III synthase [Psychrosphaera saromensis]|uniref:Uroporphyrinogen-III synthase n=1 Tax=Psychrosphaera saromensis TaxID=716813 RepID=A0A2S7USV1_9GAMM|nr:uroporphyrinogen-III synthase [Psychrosphaera saromensis]PQJ52592.1 hypothetical protein BTO11_02280 [Psychrosphaera saromensis]GHB69687.1 uroporphyrinogen-III synthase [Psychrosphaera saromensis]GLQ13063.1 uroporphyrinogen-III synthase [Psychrosphaera saromensis]